MWRWSIEGALKVRRCLGARQREKRLSTKRAARGADSGSAEARPGRWRQEESSIHPRMAEVLAALWPVPLCSQWRSREPLSKCCRVMPGVQKRGGVLRTGLGGMHARAPVERATAARFCGAGVVWPHDQRRAQRRLTRARADGRTPLPSPTQHTRLPTERTSVCAVPLQLTIVLPSSETEPPQTNMPPAAYCTQRAAEAWARAATALGPQGSARYAPPHAHDKLHMHTSHVPTAAPPTPPQPSTHAYPQSAQISAPCRCS